MAREVDRILGQLDRAYRGGAWHGPAVQEVVADLDARQASARPIPAAHTIWELVLHMTYWKEVVRGRLAGEQPQVDEARNFPEVVDRSPAAWQRALEDLSAAHEGLRAEVARIDDEALEAPTVGGTAARYVLVHGMVQHDLYHAGQIAILRKPVPEPAMAVAPPRPRTPARRKKAPSRRVAARRRPAARKRSVAARPKRRAVRKAGKVRKRR